jgi:hypothetical protein
MTTEESQMRNLEYLYGGSIGDAFALTITASRYKYEGRFGDIAVPKTKWHPQALTSLIEAVHELHRKEPRKYGYYQTPPSHVTSYFGALKELPKVKEEAERRVSMTMLAQEQISTTLSGRGLLISKKGHMGSAQFTQNLTTSL